MYCLAQTAASVIADPALDSQNRFYGVAFTLYGALLVSRPART